MELISKIVSKNNLNRAYERVIENEGASGVDEMEYYEAFQYIKKHGKEIVESILNKTYNPQPVRRVYIPKADGKKRPLGIPTIIDRIIQQAIAQVLVPIYEPIFSEYSFGFRPQRNCHQAIEVALNYMNDGYDWVIDIDIEKFFDTINHDKLISILREQVNDAHTLNLIRKFLRAGVLENGVFTGTEWGAPQGGPLSPVLSNIILDKLDKELENRGLRFARYADDCNIFVSSEMAANRVMASISSWLERKLFLKVNMTKTKVVRPNDSSFLGFGFYKEQKSNQWKTIPLEKSKTKLCRKIKQVLCRRKASAKTLSSTFIKLNQIIKGWINYYKVSDMKRFMRQFGEWLRHKVRVVIIKQWKKRVTIYNNLKQICRIMKYNFSDETVHMIAYSSLGYYRRANFKINFIITPKVLEMPKGDRPGLVNPLNYYLLRKESGI